MPEIRALIVDDEPLARRGMRQLLAPFPDIHVIAEARDGREALRALETHAPDVVFLDIQMPGVTGFDVVRLAPGARRPILVFVTAHLDYAVRAFDAEALDYLVKPLSAARVRATVDRIRARLRTHAKDPSGDHAPLAVPTSTGERLLDPQEIDWAEADDDHVVLHARDGTHRVRLTLAALERRLPQTAYARVHRSALVRLDRVREWRRGPGGDDLVAILRDGTAVPVSRRRATAFRERLGHRPPHPDSRSPRHT